MGAHTRLLYRMAMQFPDSDMQEYATGKGSSLEFAEHLCADSVIRAPKLKFPRQDASLKSPMTQHEKPGGVVNCMLELRYTSSIIHLPLSPSHCKR